MLFRSQLERAPYYAARILNIPSSTQLTADDIREAAQIIKEVLDTMAK